MANRPFDEALKVVERSCSLAGTAHRNALCFAIESATNTTVSPYARHARALVAEVERILARLWLLGTTARAANLHTLWQQALEQRETLFAALEQATGRRVYWAVAVPGGLRDGVEFGVIREALESFAPLAQDWRSAASSRGALGRSCARLGILAPERANALGVTGVAARAAGLADDLRQSSPYADVTISWPATPYTVGDAAAHVQVAAEDIATSLDIIDACYQQMSAADATPNTALGAATPGAAGQASVEGPHGAVTAQATLGGSGALASMRLETPCQALVPAIADVLAGHTVEQAPLILASLDLCLECADL